MILQYFMLNTNSILLYIKIIIIGLLYGFLTVLFFGSYSFFYSLKSLTIEKKIKIYKIKKLSETISFIIIQLILFISIYYPSIYLILNKSYVLSFLIILYLFYMFFFNSNFNVFDNNYNDFIFFKNFYKKNKLVSINFNIQYIFINNLIFYILNYFILSNSILIRLISIYIYLFNFNKYVFFLISNFIGWLIGQIIFIKLNNFIFFKIKNIKLNEFLLRIKNLLIRFINIFLFIIFIYYIVKFPLPIFNKIDKNNKFLKKEEIIKNKNIFKFKFDKFIAVLCFDFIRRNYPLRYIKNYRFENLLTNEMSQYFFYVWESDGKKKISFTNLPGTFTFIKMMKKNIPILTIENYNDNELYNCWTDINENEKKKKNNEFLNRITLLDIKLNCRNLFENIFRLCTTNEKKYLSDVYDPLLTRIHWGIIIKLNFFLVIHEKYNKLKEINKKLYQRSSKLIDELEYLEGDTEEARKWNIRSKRFKRVIIFTDSTDINDISYLIHYSQFSNFRHSIIKGSIRSKRRKIITHKLFQSRIRSPLFFFFKKKNLFTRFLINKKKKHKKIYYNKNKKKEQKIKRCMEIAEIWDAIPGAQLVRGYMLIFQSIFRKYIILPSLIIFKNIIHMLLFQYPELYEDIQEWNKEIHIKCTYNGVPLSENEFPKNWLRDGIQIKVLFPFKLWHKKKYSIKKKFFFLTPLGRGTKIPFEDSRKKFFFFTSILQILKKLILKKLIFKNFKRLKNLKIFKNFKLLIFKTNVNFNKNINFNKSENIFKNKSISIKYIKHLMINKIKKKKEEYFDEIIIIKKKIKLITKDYKKIKKFKNIKLFYKHYFLIKKYFFIKLYINIMYYLFEIVDIISIKINLFLKKKYIKNYIINLILITKRNSYVFYNPISISQIYIFYKLIKLKINFIYRLKMYRLRNILKSNYYKNKFNFLFLKNEIKKDIIRHRQFLDIDIKKNQCKTILINNNCQYNVPSIIWHKIIQNNSIYDIKLFLNQEKFEKKNYEYNFFLYTLKYLFYFDKKNILKKKNLFYFKKYKKKYINMIKNIKIDLQYVENYLNKKYFACENINFNIFKKVYINNNIETFYEILDYLLFNNKFWFLSEFLFLLNLYKKKSWIVLINSFIFNSFELNNIQKNENIFTLLNSKKKLKNEKYLKSNIKRRKIYKQRKRTETELDLFLKKYLFVQLKLTTFLKINKKIMDNIKIFCFILRLKNPQNITLSSIQRKDIFLNLMLTNFTFKKLIKRGLFIIKPININSKNNKQLIVYQTINILLFHKKENKLNKKKKIHKKLFILNLKKKNKKKYYYNLLPENYLLPKHRVKLRILNYLNINNNIKKAIIDNSFNKKKYIKIKKLIALKFFIWPNYRFEDLSCLNRFWFNTSNSSRFNMLRIKYYI
uniref:hypothetical protein RF1 n=1 Tax=Sarcophyte sanguinea TaxID=1618143 RepID=UPI0026E2D36A|nr:hypothetical protein RF1 [Sarcophyte sanguinea]WJE89095.1 hypothetical protein RF1 [Sarcophyte sanguinea]